MRYFAITFVLALLFYSCDTSGSVEDTTVVEVVNETAIDEETAEEDRWANFVHSSITVEPYYYPNSEIEYTYNEYGHLASKIEEGDRLVFYYLEIAGDKIDTITGQRLADSGYKKGLIFAIDADKTEFKLEKANFSTALAKYDFGSNTPEQGYFNVTNGFIEGTKISETEWEITTDIIWTIPANENHEDIHREFELTSNFIPAPEE